jgi:hypothetical protein
MNRARAYSFFRLSGIHSDKPEVQRLNYKGVLKMFTHRVQMQLKADSFILLSRKIENTIMPLLRLQKGFQSGTTSVAPERSIATEDTHWNTKEDAFAYDRTGYWEVMKSLTDVVSAPPVTSIFEVAESSFDQKAD